MIKVLKISFILLLLFFTVSCSKIADDSSKFSMNQANETSFVLNEFADNNLTGEQSQLVENEIKNNPDWFDFLNSNSSQLTQKNNISSGQNQLKNNFQNLGFYGNKLNWKKIISKYDILSYLKENGISVANLTEIEIINDDNFITTSIRIANKDINMKDFTKHFKLLSNRLISVSINKNEIIFFGNGFGLDPQIKLFLD